MLKMMNILLDDFEKGFVLTLGIDNFKNINENYGLKFVDSIKSSVLS